MYQCNEGFFPSHPVIATCQNETWSPDPYCKGIIIYSTPLLFQLCTSPLVCDPPESPANGSIVESSHNVTLGTEITFGCNGGYSPGDTMTAVCEESGWRPNPALLNCTRSGRVACNPAMISKLHVLHSFLLCPHMYERIKINYAVHNYYLIHGKMMTYFTLILLF